jgi:hypothetical protein
VADFWPSSATLDRTGFKTIVKGVFHRNCGLFRGKPEMAWPGFGEKGNRVEKKG